MYDMLFVMTNQIELNGRLIDFEYKPGRATKRIRLTVHPGGIIKVSAPLSMGLPSVLDFMRKKSKWILSKHDLLKHYPVVDKQQSALDYKKYKVAALEFAKQRIIYFNQFYNFKVGKISIKNSRTLWGSCSKRGNLNFNYKLVLVPPEQADYVVVHELCHLQEFNHSASFWQLVAKTIPEYKRLRHELKKSGLNFS